MTRVTMLMWPCHPHYQRLMSYHHHYFQLSAPPSEAISCWHLDVWCVLCVATCAHKNQSGLSIDLAPVLSTGASLGQGYQDNPTSSSHLLRLSPLSPVSPTNNWDPRITSHKPFFGWKVTKKSFWPPCKFIHSESWFFGENYLISAWPKFFAHSAVWCVGGCPEQPTHCPPFSLSALVTLSSLDSRLRVSQSCKQHWGPAPHSHRHSRHDQGLKKRLVIH